MDTETGFVLFVIFGIPFAIGLPIIIGMVVVRLLGSLFGKLIETITSKKKRTEEQHRYYRAEQERRRVEQERRYRAISDLQKLSPTEFEKYIAFVFQEMGYQAELRGSTNASDQGVDIEARRDGEYVVIQCKKYSKTISQPMIRDFVGTVFKEGADKGVFVTTSAFSEPAKEFARGTHVELVGPTQVIEWQQMLKIGPYKEIETPASATSALPQADVSRYTPPHLRPQEKINDIEDAEEKHLQPLSPPQPQIIVKQGMSGLQVSVIIGLTVVATVICVCGGLIALGAMVGPPPG